MQFPDVTVSIHSLAMYSEEKNVRPLPYSDGRTSRFCMGGDSAYSSNTAVALDARMLLAPGPVSPSIVRTATTCCASLVLPLKCPTAPGASLIGARSYCIDTLNTDTNNLIGTAPVF